MQLNFLLARPDESKPSLRAHFLQNPPEGLPRDAAAEAAKNKCYMAKGLLNPRGQPSPQGIESSERFRKITCSTIQFTEYIPPVGDPSDTGDNIRPGSPTIDILPFPDIDILCPN